jgi:alcohol dehydrogenase (NADP+)
MHSHGYSAPHQRAELVPFEFERRSEGSHDVAIEILYCGVCHSDLSFVDNEWGISRYPLVPGHEIVGRVTAVGDRVVGLAVGDLAAIGGIVDSCRVCRRCAEGAENLCEQGSTPTYNGFERGSGRPTYGGFANNYVVDERFALRVPLTLDPAGAAPLLCAGITTYSPLRRWGVGRGQRIGIVGLGGLGHLAIKVARAMGADVVVFTTSPGKAEDARALGATDVVISTHREQMNRYKAGLDFILDTSSGAHDLNAYIRLLKSDATLCLLGVAPEKLAFSASSLITGRKVLAGSISGGLRETQQMLDFCGEHGITADIERIALKDINTAFDRLRRNDVKYRFVIDMSK